MHNSTWVPGQEYVDYLAVSEDNTFNYASVYYNQRGDVHPPFFYILLHTVCSFFQGSFSKWYGIGLNICISVITLLVLYKMCAKHLGGKSLALAILATFALSCGCISTALFIRMYALLTLMTVLCCYAHLEIIYNDFALNRKLCIAVFFSVLGGYYTQYYFVLYAAGIAAVMCVLFLCKRRWKSLLCYVGTLAAAAAVGIAIWPFSIKHVFSGYRGRESLQILKSGDFLWLKAEYMCDNIWSYMFGGNEWLFLGFVIAGTIICICFKKKMLPYGKAALIAIPVVFYTLIVGQISPFLTDRYVMCTYPFWCIMFVAVVYHGVNCMMEVFQTKYKFSSEKMQLTALFVIAFILIGANNFVMNTPGYLSIGGQECYDVPDGTDCVYVLPNGTWNESAEDTNILAKCNRVGVVYESNLEILAEDYAQNAGEYLAIMVNYSLDADSILQRVRDSFHIEDMREIRRDYGGNVLRILLQK